MHTVGIAQEASRLWNIFDKKKKRKFKRKHIEYNAHDEQIVDWYLNVVVQYLRSFAMYIFFRFASLFDIMKNEKLTIAT